jgi:hypothetical protein
MTAKKKEPKLKLRTSYPKELRAEAKAAGKGVITVSIEFPNGERSEVQSTGNAAECKFALWAGVILSEPQVTSLLDLEEIVRMTVE